MIICASSTKHMKSYLIVEIFNTSNPEISGSQKPNIGIIFECYTYLNWTSICYKIVSDFSLDFPIVSIDKKDSYHIWQYMAIYSSTENEV